MSDIRATDLQLQTHYFSEFLNCKEWPAYIDIFEMTDFVNDIFYEYDAENASDNDECPMDKKYHPAPKARFTPTLDEYLRRLFQLDKHEGGWFGKLANVSIDKELARANIDLDGFQRLSGTARDYLGYGLCCSRRNMLPDLVSFCVFEAIVEELKLHAIILPSLALSRNIQFSHPAEARHEIQVTAERLSQILGEPINPEHLVGYLHWSTNAAKSNWFSVDFIERLNLVLKIKLNIDLNIFPSKEEASQLYSLAFCNGKMGCLLKELTLTG